MNKSLILILGLLVSAPSSSFAIAKKMRCKKTTGAVGAVQLKKPLKMPKSTGSPALPGELTVDDMANLASVIGRLMPRDRLTDVKDNHAIDTPMGSVGISATADSSDIKLFKSIAERYLPAPTLVVDYIALGAVVGDQARAMFMMALGDHLGLWKVVSPMTIKLFESFPEDQRLALLRAGRFFGITRTEDFEAQAADFRSGGGGFRE